MNNSLRVSYAVFSISTISGITEYISTLNLIMIKPQIPSNEAERLHALKTLEILDTAHEERFDRVTCVAN